MRQFRFTLEAVRTLRQRQEQLAMEEYARALLARHDALQRMRALEEELSGAWEQARRRLRQGCPAWEMAALKLSEKLLQERRQAADKVFQDCEARAREAFRALLAARKEREIVDKCREKQRAAHELECARQETKLMDELGARRIAPALAWRNRSQTR
jgi:flagellar export protein FliJ